MEQQSEEIAYNEDCKARMEYTVTYVLNIENFNAKPAVCCCERNQFPHCERILSLRISC